MKALYIVILIHLISVSIAEALPPKGVTTVDIVLSGLRDQSWNEDERPCLDQTLKVLNNVRNYTVWAVWIWNSMHHPVGTFYGSEYSLGNYDQCLNVPSTAADPKIVTQYCLADVKLTSEKYEGDDRNVLGSTGPYVTTKTPIGRNLNKVTWGTCLPSTCKAGSISKIMKTIIPNQPSNSVSAGDYCQFLSSCWGEEGVQFWLLCFYNINNHAFNCINSFNMLSSILNNKIWSLILISVIHGIADAFSMRRNWTSLTKKSNEDLEFLNLLKVFLATVVVGGHTAFFEMIGPISNGLYFDEVFLETKNPILNSFKHFDLIVDSFFMVSGLLLVKGFMEKKKNPMVALTNRYFRLTASFAVVMFYVASVSMYTGDGPFWQKFAGREQKACADTWWLGLLMLSNYVNSENICILASWSIPCDYQLAIMGTVFYLIWQKNRIMGQVVTSITVILALLIPGVITYWKKLPASLLFHDLEQIRDLRTNDVYLDTYIRGHNRAGPYLIGMAMGYIISVYKPDNYRNVISKKRLVLLLAAASTVSWKVLTEPLAWATLEYDHLSSALYAIFSRNLWALCTCITIGIVEYGDIAPVHNFTSWHGFTILSRLTYGVYLTHSVIIQQNLYSRRNLQQFDCMYSEGLHSGAVTMLSIIFAVLLWMFVDAPINNIVNLAINSGSKYQSRNQRTKEELETAGFEEATTKIKQS